MSLGPKKTEKHSKTRLDYYYVAAILSNLFFLLYTIHKNMSLGPSKTKSDSKIGQRKAIEKRNMKREICFPI